MSTMDPKQVEDFLQQIKLRGFDDSYISAAEEKEIYQEAVKTGVDLDRARAFLRQACARFDYALESELRGILEVVFQTFQANDGKVDIEEYNNAIGIGMALLKRQAPRCTVTKQDVQKIAVDICKRQNFLNPKLAKQLGKAGVSVA